ncbi:MAG TPA: GNAT family N-acetyltransferase [Polyangia bacterium]|nr:GNAT family N-acetyltransferase [Polyangia bacterium]
MIEGARAAPGGVRVEVHPWTAWPRWSATWAELAQVTAPRAGFFLGPHWIETWIQIFGPQLQPRILVFHRDGGAAGICLIVSRRERRGPVPVRRLYLNAAGEDEADETCLEYNRLLCRPEDRPAVVTALGAWLARESWDEFAAFALAEAIVPEALSACRLERSEKNSCFVDLTAFPATLDGFLAVLSRNSREQIRRSLKLYRQSGEIALQAAATVDEGHAFLDQLGALHQTSWAARGQPGVFSSARFMAFHRALVARALPAGNVLLLRVAVGASPIGLLYGFREAGSFFFYQSGLSPSSDNRMKPGLVAHACAIAHCAAAGLKEYDFLAGESQYKRSLSTGTRSLTWLLWRRRGLRLAAIDLLRGARQRLRRLRGAAAS